MTSQMNNKKRNAEKRKWRKQENMERKAWYILHKEIEEYDTPKDRYFDLEEKERRRKLKANQRS